MKFLSRTSSAVPTPTPEPDHESAGSGGKGRPTPKRKEAEAQRKQTLKVPTDPKAAKKAARARAAEERAAQRQAMLDGDEKHLPARDAGPVKSFVRDFIDSRWAAAEFFLPLAVLVLVVGLLPMRQIQGMVSMFWMFLTLFIVVDTTLVMVRLNRELKRRWPLKAERKGAIFYAVMRVLQLRRLRLPPPRMRAGGKPVKPKKKKSPKS